MCKMASQRRARVPGFISSCDISTRLRPAYHHSPFSLWTSSTDCCKPNQSGCCPDRRNWSSQTGCVHVCRLFAGLGLAGLVDIFAEINSNQALQPLGHQAHPAPGPFAPLSSLLHPCFLQVVLALVQLHLRLASAWTQPPSVLWAAWSPLLPCAIILPPRRLLVFLLFSYPLIYNLI